MELILLCFSSGLVILGITRYLIFKYRLRHYTKSKGVIINYEVETKYFSTGGVEVDEVQYDRFSKISNWKRVKYYSPEISYHANDGHEYNGTWWTEMPNGIPRNIGELVEIFYNPDKPRQFFMYDKMMMFWEPLLLTIIGILGMGFMLYQIIYS